MEEARRNDEIITLASSQILRWIDELNGVTDAADKAREIKQQMRNLSRQDNDSQNRKKMRALRSELEELQFKKDYMCLIIDREKDYRMACRGFNINGVRYRRLLGTPNGIKNSTIVFVSERLHPEISRRIENNRDPNKPIVAAKLEAYKGLTCSASNPVSFPKGICIVNDAENDFFSDVIYLSNASSDEPVMEYKENYPIHLVASDGFGLMLPALSERWSEELKLGYLCAGMNTRFSFEKGMLFTFDFIDFAENVAGTYIIKDAWGNDVDLRNVEAILTTSMVKLWDSYADCESYIQSSLSNGYTFGVTKCSPEHLESERTLNYQFIQSYDLSDADIDELIEPTMNEIHSVLGGDWRKAVLFINGSNLDARDIFRGKADIGKAMMIDRRMAYDPFVQHTLYSLIKNRINEAKIGVLNVHGNYSIISGDPFMLCQSMFGLQKTGLLKSGEIYNKYWSDYGADKLACFRAPMTCHNNIRIVHPVTGEQIDHWYQYMNTVTILNAYDTTTMALNGADFDSDTVMLTDNSVLVNKLVESPAIMCEQRKVDKKIPTEADLIESNIKSFGTEIGQITNRITSMFEVQNGFERNSLEYKMLDYRIKCGQLLQQDSIDKAKGVVSKPMSRTWYDRHAVNQIENDDIRLLYRKIVAARKPYFMIYIYPDLMRQYKTYIRNTASACMREFRISIDELQSMPYSKLTDRQKEFLHYYEKNMPVGRNKCVMNRICERFEKEFDASLNRYIRPYDFDYTIMKSFSPYTKSQYYTIKHLYDEYNKKLSGYAVVSNYERIDKDDSLAGLKMMTDEFKAACYNVCPNALSLCDILLDICYKKDATKRFAWNLCGDIIIGNLLYNNGNTVSFPVLDPDGDIEFRGNKFKEICVHIDDNMDTLNFGMED